MQEIEHLARLSKLALSNEEKERLTGEMLWKTVAGEEKKNKKPTGKQ